jgi:Tol biopolymer transport system component
MTIRQNDLGPSLRALLQAEAEAMEIDVPTAAGRLQRDLTRSSQHRRRRIAVGFAGLAAVAAGVVGAVLWNGHSTVRSTPPPADTRPVPSPTGLAALGPRAHGIAIVDLNGKTLRRIPGLPGDADALSLSPDQTRIAFNTAGPSSRSQIATIRTDGSRLQELGPAGMFTYAPTWSPDGTMIAFMGEPAHGPGPQFQIFVMDADGSDVRRLTNPNNLGADPAWSMAAQPQWSPDGSTIVFSRETEPETEHGWSGRIWTVPLDGGLPSPLTTTSGSDEHDPAYSPDGSQICYYRDGGIWVMRADGTHPRKLVVVGFAPRWSPDGSLIAYTTSEGRSRTTPAKSMSLNVVDVATGKHRQVVDVAVNENPPVWWTSNTLLIQRPVQ